MPDTPGYNNDATGYDREIEATRSDWNRTPVDFVAHEVLYQKSLPTFEFNQDDEDDQNWRCDGKDGRKDASVRVRIFQYKYSVSKDTPVQNTQSVRIFQYKYSVIKDIPVQNTQSVRIFQYKYSVSKDIPVRNTQSLRIFQDKNQSVRIFQYKILSQ